MKQVFEDLILFLKLQQDNFYYDTVEGTEEFDPSALWSEIRSFALELEKQIH
jgi:hypothetical protein